MAMRAKAKYDYQSSTPGDLSFKAGDVVEVVSSDVVSGWWTGRLAGTDAPPMQFPGEYVDLERPPIAPRPLPPPPAPRTTAPPAPLEQMARVLWDYAPSVSDELAVQAGVVVSITQSPDPEWWMAVTPEGQRGLLPKNYCDLLEQPARPARPSRMASGGASASLPGASASTAPPPVGVVNAPALSSTTGGYLLGGSMPVWMHPTFASLVADRHTNALLRRSTTAREEFEMLSQSFSFFSVLYERMASRLGDALATKAVLQALNVGVWAAANLPVPGRSNVQQHDDNSVELNFDSDKPQRGDPSERFHLFLYSFVEKIRAMRSGDCIIVPCGWTTNPIARAPDAASAPPARGQFIVIVAHKGETWELSVVNDGSDPTDASLEYHAAGFDVATGKTKRSPFMFFDGIPRSRLADSSFWFMLFRLVVFPHAENTPARLYEVLLPYLNQVPLRTHPGAAKRIFKSTKPRPGDDRRAHLVKTAIQVCLQAHIGLSHQDAKRAGAELRRELCAVVAADAKVATMLSADEALVATLALRQTAESAAKLADSEPALIDTRTLADVSELVRTVEATLKSKSPNPFPPPPPLALQKSTVAPWGAAFPLFGRFRRDTAVDHLAGRRKEAQILRPVQLTLVATHVDTFHDVAVALRQCAHACTLLDNQQALIRNTYCLRVALIQHLFTYVIPLPAPCDRSATCFWQSRGMRYETQADLLRLLEIVGRHFCSASLSLRVTRSFDAARIVTMACIATIADVVARKVADDVPSQFSLHLSGEAEGPVAPFGFEMGYFLEESGFLEFADARLAAARSQILDYFAAQRALLVLDDEHVLFRFEQSMTLGKGDAKLIDQLCVQMGFPRNSRDDAGAAAYLAGQDSLLVDNYPELALYRDICFLFKALLTPTSGALPAVKTWSVTDARLVWSAKKPPTPAKGEPPMGGTLQAAGFGSKELQCAAFARQYRVNDLPGSEGRGVLKTFLGFFGLGPDDRPRAPPSGANPSNLANQPIVSEDDVLHVKTLPDFGGRLGARDCELLLTYLTAPYIRIPLVLEFFAEQSRITALASPELQGVIDACLFEPSLYQSEIDAQSPPDTVPVKNRSSLATPAGLLFNELQRCPHVVLAAIEDMIFYAIELDVGKYSSSTSAVLLYVTRLAAKVLGYLDFICDCAAQLALPPGGHSRQRVRGVGEPSVLPLSGLRVLEKARTRLRGKLAGPVLSTLELWCEGAVKHKDVQLACVLHAHMALVFQGVEAFDYRSAAITLCAYVFITVNFRFTVEADITRAPAQRQDAEVELETLRRLGVSQTDLFFLFQRQRPLLMAFFNANAADRNESMEAVVRVVTMTGTSARSSGANGGGEAQQVRSWTSMERPGCDGRFMPDTEKRGYREALSKLREVKDFEEWLRRVTTLAVDTEINVQLGEFTLKKNPMQLLPDDVFAFDDFKYVIGEFHPERGDALQCAEVNNTENRQWWRLVGKRHDVQVWVPDTRAGMHTPFKRPYAGGLTPGEAWLERTFEPYRAALFPHVEFFLPASAFDAQHFARLAGLLVSAPVAGGAKEPPKRPKRGNEADDALPAAPVPPSLLEVVAFKDPPTVHVYLVTEHGRRFYSSLVFSSDCSFTFGDFSASDSKHVNWTPQGIRLSAGRVPTGPLAPARSLVLSRNLSADAGVQQFVPAKFIRGLLPEALLERYDFWQSEADDSLAGLPKNKDDASRLVVELFKDKTVDETGYGNSMAYAVVRRYTRESAGGGPETCHTLLNPLFAPPGGPLRTLCQITQRLDNLSHVLIWSQSRVARPNDEASIDRLEFPRVKLAFAKHIAAHDECRLVSEEHSGLFLSSRRDDEVLRLIEGLGNCLVLENDQAELFILLPATTRPSRPVNAATALTCDVLLDPSHPEWLANVGKDVRHYVYPVHLSRMFLFTPTLASALYLLMMRFASRAYREAFRMADACVTDTPLSSEEKQIFEHLGAFSDDQSPDAHAVRLKITLASLGSRDTMHCPWDLASEYQLYHRNFARVQAACRLTIREEAALHGELAGLPDNRWKLCVALLTQQPQDLIAPPIKTDFAQFDLVQDTTALEDRKSASSWTQTLRKFSSAKPITYARPDEMTGAPALRYFEKAMRGGVSVRGTGGTVGFVFLYELMTGSLPMRILNEDSCYNWGCLLLRHMPPKKYQKKQTMTSLLRVLTYNPRLAASFPKYEDTRKHKISIMFKGQNVIQKLLESANQLLRSRPASDIAWPRFDAGLLKGDDFPAKVVIKETNYRRARLFGLDLRVADLSLGERVVDAPSRAMCEKPLGEFDRFVLDKTRRQRGLADYAPVKLGVEGHPAARSKAARDVLLRLAVDVEHFCADANAATEPEMAPCDLNELHAALERAIQAVRYARVAPIGHLTRRRHACRTSPKSRRTLRSAWLWPTASRWRRRAGLRLRCAGSAAPSLRCGLKWSRRR